MTLKIALLGDICLNGKFDLGKNPNAKEYFNDVAEYLSGFDYVVANLETPLTDRNFTLTCKGLHLKSSIKSIEILKYLNVNIVSLANNHIYDYGPMGLADTIEALNSIGIDYYGIKNKQVHIQDKGSRIAIGGYCCFSSNPSFCHTKGVNPLIPEYINKINLINKNEGFINLNSLHWGDENIHYPRYDHIKIARYLAYESPLIVHGHHTHVIQGIETLNNSIIAYSQGNFCTDDVHSSAVKNLKVVQQKSNKESYILELEIKANKIIKQKAIPIIDNGNQILIGASKVSQDLDIYSSALNKDKNDYIKFRHKELENINQANESKRTFKWFFRRLNYYFIGAYIKGKMSTIKYNKIIKNLQDID